MNPQAQELNKTIEHSSFYHFLSKRGKEIFYPKKGILAQTADAKGKSINATIGSAVEDDGSPMRLGSLAKQTTLEASDCFTYAPSFGKEELRKRWASLIKEKNPSLKGSFSTPLITNALTHGLSILGFLFIDETDQIILHDKYWGNYNLMFTHWFGSSFHTYNTFTDTGFDLKSFSDALQEPKDKKIVLLNFPNNPTGYTPTQEEAKKIIELLKKQAEQEKILVILDDAYFGLVYEEGIEKESLFSSLADCSENLCVIKVDGPTKEDYVWGFRVGFLSFATKNGSKELYEALELKGAGAIRGNISNASHPPQSMLLAAYQDKDYSSQKEEKYTLLKSRYEEVKQVLANHPEYSSHFKALPYNSGYFMCIELASGLDSETIRQKLLAEYDTGVISIGNLLRLAYSSLKKEHITKLFENIYKACNDEH